MNSRVSKEELSLLWDFARAEQKVRGVMGEMTSGVALVTFLARYTHWNGFFGSGVAALAGKVGRSRTLFMDGSEPVTALADRSVLVASYFFDAARDEFDDRDTPHRDTHRCLAQALLKGLLGFLGRSEPRFQDPAFVNELCAPPVWLRALGSRVAQGYGGGGFDDAASIFRAIGYHLGSEILADREFSLIDEALRRRHAGLVSHLEKTPVEIAGQSHQAYRWLSVHSGHGGQVEADHFEWATKGARLGLDFVAARERPFFRRQLHLGFVDFARDHEEFFDNVREFQEPS